MATEVKRRRGTTVEHSTFTGAVAELTVDLTKDTVVVHDGATQGGFPLLREDLSNVPTTAPFTNISLDTAIFDTAYTADGNEAQGTLYWNEDELTLSLVTNGQTTELGQKVEVHVKNQTGAQINKGEVVYASGTVGSSGRITVAKMIADGTISAKRVVGVAAENIADGADGKVVHFGKIRQLNTDSFNEGDILWVSTTTAGAFQNTEPVQADGDLALPIAFVVTKSINNGELFVRINAIDENEYTDYADYVELRSDVIENHLEIESLQDNKVEKGQLFPDGDEQALGTGDNVTFNALTANGATDLNSTLNVQGVLTTQNNVLDDGFTEGWSGTNWRITADGSAELEELRVRGALRVYEFIAKQISTIGGSEILSIANGRVESVDNVSTPKTITIDNVGSPATSFQAGDLWIIQEVDINSGSVTSVYGEVDAVQTGSNANVLEVSVTSGDLSQVEQGNIIVAYGNVSDTARQNIMYRNVDASEDNLIMRLQTGITDFNELKAVGNTRVAFGDLNGYSGLSTETFGFFAGDNSNEHILVTDGGLFLKDGTTVLAQLTSNTFKVGDVTNFVSFNGTTFDIQTDTFNLDTTNLSIDSANELITIGSADSVSLGKKLSLSASSDIDYRDSLDKYASTVDFFGLYLNPENYFGFVQDNEDFGIADGYNFRVGGETSNYIEVNGATGDVDIKFDTFDLTSGNLRIKSGGTTYPSVNTGATSSNVSSVSFTSSPSATILTLSISDNQWAKFQFDYSLADVSAFNFDMSVEIMKIISGTDTSIGFSDDIIYDLNSIYAYADETTGSTINNITNTSDNSQVSLRFQGTSDSSSTGTITFYMKIFDAGSVDELGLKFINNNTFTSGSAEVEEIDGVIYNTVTELNPNGLFQRLTDSIISQNGDTFFNPSLITDA